MTDGWQQQPGGLWVKVSPFDRHDSEQREAAAAVMRNSIETIARTHGASLDVKGFRANMDAVARGDLEVDFYLAKWDVCERKPVCLGANFGWNTYHFTDDGQLARAFYTEDVCLLREQLRTLLGAKPNGLKPPKDSLAQIFERLSLQAMEAEGITYRFGEVNADNTAMMRQLGGNGAEIAVGAGSAVLEFNRLPDNLLRGFPMMPEVVPIMRGGRQSENHFYVQWKEDSHDIRFMVTKGRATVLGKPRADIRPWHNGNLPDQMILESVIASSLAVIRDEIEDERKWGKDYELPKPSPVIPIDEPRPAIYKALYSAAGDEVAAVDHSCTFHKPMPEAHVFVQNDQNMLDGFVEVGAERRLFGIKPMAPVVNILGLAA